MQETESCISLVIVPHSLGRQGQTISTTKQIMLSKQICITVQEKFLIFPEPMVTVVRLIIKTAKYFLD